MPFCCKHVFCSPSEPLWFTSFWFLANVYHPIIVGVALTREYLVIGDIKKTAWLDDGDDFLIYVNTQAHRTKLQSSFNKTFLTFRNAKSVWLSELFPVVEAFGLEGWFQRRPEQAVRTRRCWTQPDKEQRGKGHKWHSQTEFVSLLLSETDTRWENDVDEAGGRFVSPAVIGAGGGPA